MVWRKASDYLYKGDVVRVHLNMDEKTLAFSVNGTYLGIAVTGLPGKVYSAAVSLMFVKESVRIRFAATPFLNSSPDAETDPKASKPKKKFAWTGWWRRK